MAKNNPTRAAAAVKYDITAVFNDFAIIEVTSIPEQSKSTKLTLSPEIKVEKSIKTEKIPEATAMKPRRAVATPTRMQNIKVRF